jgi:REP element-mobilizing transposase RayT
VLRFETICKPLPYGGIRYDGDMPQSRRSIRLAHDVYTRPGATASLTICTHDRRPVLASEEAAEVIVDVLRSAHGSDWRLLAHCVMPDHVHVLAMTSGRSLIDLVRVVKGRSAARLRAGLGLSGVWQRAFHDHMVRRGEDLVTTIRYMLENPVRKGMCDDWQTYPWSGSLQWPAISAEFLTANPSSVLWQDVDWGGITPTPHENLT